MRLHPGSIASVKALRLHSTRNLRLHDEADPHPVGGEELVRVSAVGICGSDIHWLEEGGIGDAQIDRPLVLGHEFSGVVADGPRAGLRVAVDPAIPCGSCRFCSEGNTNFCIHLRFAGHGEQDGALRTLLSWPSSRLHPIPDTLSDDEGALLEPLGVAIHAVDLGKIKAGAQVGIFGCGPIGLLIQQVAVARGATVAVATDPISHRREAARGYGAELVLDPSKDDFQFELQRLHTTPGLDVTFEASNNAAGIRDAVEAVRAGGRVVVTGIPTDDQIQLRASTARRKGLTMLLTRRMREVYPRAIQLARSGAVDLKGLVTHRYPLDQYSEAFEAARARIGHKVIIHP